jgi:DNA polymerase-3 subunit chi
MRVDFYVLGQNPPDAIVTALAAKAVADGERLLIVEADQARRSALSNALWQARPEQFLANGLAGDAHAARQPILISDRAEAENGARLLCLADGKWRNGDGFERVLYLFGDEALADARGQWRGLGGMAETERHFWKQDDRGRWIEGP